MPGVYSIGIQLEAVRASETAKAQPVMIGSPSVKINWASNIRESQMNSELAKKLKYNFVLINALHQFT